MKNLKEVLLELLNEDKINLRKKSFQSYQTKIKYFNEWLDNQGLSEITTIEFTHEQARRFLNGLQLNAETRRSYQRTLSKYFNWLFKAEKIARNPFTNHKLPKSSNDKALRAFKDAEIKAIKKYCLGNDLQKLWVFIQVMFYSLIRVNETRLLRIDDLDFDKELIIIRGNVSKNNRKQSVEMASDLQKVLQGFIGKRKSGYVFCKGEAIETPMSSNYFTDLHKKALIALNLDFKDVALYSWKHTGAIKFYEKTKDLNRLKKQCRHTELTITERYLKSLDYEGDKSQRINFPSLESY
ncbi:MAG: site-specific integrase [Microscillaceae bacterium]|jgi:site-specific recombinase XerD|nr:site-specific integrase [Microscillaceae bacterium]